MSGFGASVRPHVKRLALVAFGLAIAVPGRGIAAQEGRWDELRSQVVKLYQAGRYAEAIPPAKDALRIAEASNADGSAVALSLDDLAKLYRAQGRYGEAEPLLRRSLGIWERALGPDHPDIATSLNNLANLYQDQGRYAEAEPVYRRSLGIWEKALGPNHPHVATALNNLALLYSAQGRYSEAEPLFRRSLGTREKALGPDHPDVAPSLNNLAALYLAQGRHREAESLLRRSLGIWEKALGPDHPDVALSLNNLAALYRDLSRYGDAEPLYRRSLAIREKALGPNHPDVAQSLNNLATLYSDQGRYGETEPLYRRSLGALEKALGPDHPSVALSLNNLAALYRDLGRYSDAEPLYRRSLGILDKALGPDHPDVATSLNNLAQLHRALGRYDEAEPLCRRSLGILEKALGPEHPHVANSLNNLAGLHWDQRRYREAESLVRRSLGISEKALGPDHPDVALSLNNLAELHRALGRYDEAEPLYRRSLGILEKALGPDHPHVANFLNGLATQYVVQSRYGEAEPLLRRSLAIREKALGADHPDVARSLNNLATLYSDQGRHGEAEPLLRRSLAIQEKALGPDHPDVALSLSNLAALYRAVGRYGQAEPVLRRSVGILERAVGPDHPDVAVLVENLAVLAYARADPRSAEGLFDRALKNLARQFEYHFTYMSERERLTYLETVYHRFQLYFSFCFTYREGNQALVAQMYDTLLWRKGFIATSLAALRKRIEATGDREAVALLERLAERRTRLAQLLTGKSAARGVPREMIADLDREAQAIEKELVERVSGLAEEKRLGRATWRDVQKALKPHEAAVEIVRFDYHDGKKWTGQAYYAALVVTPQGSAPSFVLLGDARELESAGLWDYRERTRRPGTRVLVYPEPRPGEQARPASFAALWKPLEPALADARRVYLAPDGQLHRVAWGLLAREDGSLLLESVDLRLMSSTKDLLRAPRSSSGRGAVLVGNPRFGLADTLQRAAATRFRETRPEATAGTRGSGLRSRDKWPGSIPALPGTQVEVQSLRELFRSRGWPVDVLTEDRALEEAVKGLKAPRVLHLATHGFFLPDQEAPEERGLSRLGLEERPPTQEDPMLRSGILLAGAERALSGAAGSPDLEDGWLTAYETMGLNLHGTELVTLSACETGLGDVKAGEGVFGLRRALEVAGAEAVLMSLWAVPDRETQELMSSFYRRWLSGRGKHEALRDAQLEMRQTVKNRHGRDLPYYWGAFVLVGR